VEDGGCEGMVTERARHRSFLRGRDCVTTGAVISGRAQRSYR